MRQFLLTVMLVCLTGSNAWAQSWTFAREGVRYVIDLPSPSWRVVSRVDVHEHVEFVNGSDEANGYLRVSKVLVDSGMSAFDLFQFEEKWRLQRLPGYTICDDRNGEAVRGYLTGASFSYEYINAGRVTAARIYYLQVDNRTFYALRFTVAQEKLPRIREQMEFIAHTFRLK